MRKTIHRRALLQGLGYGAVLRCSLGQSVLAPSLSAFAHGGDSPQRVTPEAQGVSSDAILEFIDRAEAQHEIHSIAVKRHGHTLAEAWWMPYRREAVHSLYSLSKSFTATAVGFAAAERRLRLDDPVIGFFPDKLPQTISDHLRALRIEHLLTMSTGHAADPTEQMIRQGDWVKVALSTPLQFAPGSTFLYNSAASYLLSAIVQRVAGQRLIEYLEPRLFHPLGIRQKRWEVCPRGINTGGWGLSVTTQSLADFGQLYSQKGRWQGRQLLPEGWAEAATSLKIQPPENPSASSASTDRGPAMSRAAEKETSDWSQGYGYQFWRCRYGAYRGDGAYGQFCIVLPEKNAVIATTSRTENMQGLLDKVWDFSRAMRDKALPEAPGAALNLRRELTRRSLAPPAGMPASSAISVEKSYTLEPNTFGATSVTLAIRGDACSFSLLGPTGISQVQGAMGKWLDGTTNMPGTPPRLALASDDLRPLKVAAAGAWKDRHTFQMQWRYYETPHSDLVTCRLDDDRLRVEFMSDSVAASAGRISDVRPVLVGSAL